jgi:hypothetical protein
LGVWNQNLKGTSNLSLNESKSGNSKLRVLIDNTFEVFDLECILLASKKTKYFWIWDSLQEF